MAKFPTNGSLPIPKSGDASCPSNYRPISILPILSKLLERHIYQIIDSHISTSAPISDDQWGFSFGKSTSLALLSNTHDWYQSLDHGNEVCTVFLDLCKAFDSVPHEPLLSKLHGMNLNPYILKWLFCYLLNRRQSVVVNGEQSPSLPVISGVPQGSVIGPLLFLIYINDITTSVSHSKLSLYADDIALYRTIHSVIDYLLLQADVNSVANWVGINHLNFNIPKCCYICFSWKRYLSIPPPVLSIGGVDLRRVDNTKYLGLSLSSDLSWSDHITNLCRKTKRLIGMLYRQFYAHADTPTLLKLYVAFIRPHLEYACTIWSPSTKKDIVALENVQKFALKVSLKQWTLSYEDMLDRANIPSLSSRRQNLSLCQL